MINLLILEDEETVRNSLANFFEDYEYNVFSAMSSEDALEIMQDNSIDAVVVDLRLPGKSGDEFILEAYSTNDNTIYVIHSGSTDYNMPNILKELERVSNKIFPKPQLDLTFLKEEIEMFINKFGNKN